MQFLSSPMYPSFRAFAEHVETSCLICSPYIGAAPVQQLTQAIHRRGISETVRVQILTDLSADNLVSGSTDISALLLLTEQIRHVELIYLPKIHAKVYVANDSLAIIASANFTSGGLFANLEYGVAVDRPEQIARVTRDIGTYSKLGSIVAENHLRSVSRQVDLLRSAMQKEQSSVSEQIRSLSDELRRDAEDELIKIRIQGRTINAIFTDTVLYLLSGRSMTTTEIHDYVQKIHPDLCNDAVDRVIDGERFGRLWKHQVRTAQQHLKRRGLIVYDEERQVWHLAP